MQGLNQVSVIYRTSNSSFASSYDQLARAFPSIRFIKQSASPHTDFQPLLLETAFNPDNTCPYLIFAVDDIIVKDPVDFKQCIQALEKTKAYGFYLAHGLHLNYCFMQDKAQKIPKHVTVDKDIYGWKFKEAEADWNYPNSLDMVLYRKADIEKDLRSLSFYEPQYS